MFFMAPLEVDLMNKGMKFYSNLMTRLCKKCRRLTDVVAFFHVHE